MIILRILDLITVFCLSRLGVDFASGSQAPGRPERDCRDNSHMHPSHNSRLLLDFGPHVMLLTEIVTLGLW